MSEKLRLRTALGKHPWVAPLRDGRVTSSRIEFEFVDIEPLPQAFRMFVRDKDLDVSELAVVTHLLAHHYGRPIKGIAIPLWSRLPHTNLVCPVESDIRVPSDLNSRKVGVRAYAQTSGVWVRGVLASEYGVDLDSITWGTMEDAHLPEYIDPANTHRYRSPPSLRDLMIQKEFAAIMGERVVDPSGIRSVIPDADAAAHDWMNRNRIFPINHILAIREELTARYPWLPEELMSLFQNAREMAKAVGVKDTPPYGFEACCRSLQLCLQFSAEQCVTPRMYDAAELFYQI